jgi:inward rectifier potassium channel
LFGRIGFFVRKYLNIMLKLGRTPRRISTNPLDRELGFGKALAPTSRLMNSNGSFNVRREAISFWDNTYHFLVTMSWSAFFLLALTFFVLLNMFFAMVYVAIGVEHLNGMTPGDFIHNFVQAFFFSSQTLTTVGYGHMSPNGLAISIMASFESFLGLLTFALISGLLYGRFSRPSAQIVFSKNLLVSPYKEGQGIMFRMVNARRSELIETEVQVLMAFNQRDEAGNTARKFYPLALEVAKISFFSLSWTVVHPLNENSPVKDFTLQDFIDANAEFMVLVKGTDETSQQIVHARHSYAADEIVWNAKFVPILAYDGGDVPKVMTSQIGRYETAYG